MISIGLGVLGLSAIGLIEEQYFTTHQKHSESTEIPWSILSTHCYRKRNAASAGTQGAFPYAEAIADGEAINRCPPGGQATVDRIANLLGTDSLALDADKNIVDQDLVALIIEEECIGCTKCIQACPVDAIVGANKLMHTVIIDDCTGCDLCVDPCPVDCIDMVPRPKHQISGCHSIPI